MALEEITTTQAAHAVFDRSSEVRISWAYRIRAFLDSGMRDYSLITRDDLDKFHQHLTSTLGLHNLPDPRDYVCPQCGPDPRGADVHAEDKHTARGLMGDPRSCDVCGVDDIPRVEWPWWKDGRPIHALCGLPNDATLLQKAQAERAEMFVRQGSPVI